METTATSKVSHLVYKYCVLKLSEKQDMYLSSLIAACNNMWMSIPLAWMLIVHSTYRITTFSVF